MRYTPALALTLGLVTLVAAAASAQVVRPRQPVALPHAAMSPARGPYAHPKRAHVAYGSIVSLGDNTLVLLVRGHKQIQVDSAPAIAAGTFSYPLSVGKFVAVEGEYGPDRVLHASNITRLTRLDDSTGPDR